MGKLLAQGSTIAVRIVRRNVLVICLLGYFVVLWYLKTPYSSTVSGAVQIESKDPESAGIEEDSNKTKIISMGLPKTGTTATAVALQNLGLKVAHNMGDKLERCDVIINTMESKYEALYYKHPTVKWIVTYTSNVSQWIDSVREHLMKGEYVPCSVYGGCQVDFGALNTTRTSTYTKYLQHLPVTTGKQGRDVLQVPINDTIAIAELYDRYYVGLFSFLESKQLPYAYVDVRANDYRNLEWIHPKLQGPFEPKNTRNNRGQWPRCT